MQFYEKNCYKSYNQSFPPILGYIDVEQRTVEEMEIQIRNEILPVIERNFFRQFLCQYYIWQFKILGEQIFANTVFCQINQKSW